MQHILEVLESKAMKDQLKMALPSGVDLDRFVRTTRTYLQESANNNPKFLQCEAKAVFSGVMKGAQWGLELGTGQCHLVPKGRNVQFLVGYQGYISLMKRNLELDVLTTQTVYKNDTIEFDYGSSPSFKHSWKFGEDRGPVTGFYCHAKFKNGSQTWETMTKKEMDIFKKEHGGFLWSKNEKQMALKTMIVRLAKRLGLEDVDRAFSNADEQILDKDGRVTWPEVTEPQ
tara:strand:- start:687 stop:1373 length:687 start_codon:yes stop_codon:yes gene_type:complete